MRKGREEGGEGGLAGEGAGSEGKCDQNASCTGKNGTVKSVKCRERRRP